jgi:hypothetical protein
MSALGQKQTLRRSTAMSAIPPKADIAQRDCHVRFAPEADSRSKIVTYSTTSSTRASSAAGTAADLLLPRSWRFGFQINDQTTNTHSESKQRIFQYHDRCRRENAQRRD